MREDPAGRAQFYAFLGALFLCLGLVAWMIAPYLLALFLGGLLALLASPVHQRLSRAIPPAAAAAVSTVLLLILVIGPATAFTIVAVRQGVALGQELADARELAPGALDRAMRRLPAALGAVRSEETAAQIRGSVRSLGLAATRAIVRLAAGIPQFLLQLLLALVAFYFFLLDGRRFVDFALSRAALAPDVRERLRRTVRDTALSTVLAGLAAATAQAALITAGYGVLGVPGGFLAGAGTFVLAWLPLLGSLPASAAGAGYLYSQGETGRMAAMIAVAVAAGLVDNLVRPLVLQGREGLHPLVGLVSIIAGIDMFGFLGLFLGPLLAAVAIALLDIWKEIGARYGVDVAHDPR